MTEISTDPLFGNGDLVATLDAHLQSVVDQVNKIPKDQFMVSREDEIVANIMSQMYIEPIILHEEAITMESEEIQIDVSENRCRYISDRSKPYLIPGIRVIIIIPFTGDENLWKLRPSRYPMVVPNGEIKSPKYNNPGYLCLIFEQTTDSPGKAIKDEYTRQLGLINDYLHNQETDIKKCNEQLDSRIRQAIRARLERLEKQNGIVAMLGIPLKQKAGVPEIMPIRVERRLIQPLPPPPSSGFQPEPGITDKDYEDILSIIRNEGRTFETTPSTYAVHDEEELRDILLAHLNGHYKGSATGETFRKSGKTDIRIEDKDRSAFIAECKVWEGEKKLQDAIDQLLSYLTWRDCKCSIIIFNKHNAKFSELLEKVPAILRSDTKLNNDLGEKGQGEWRFILHTKEDEARRIIVHVFLFNIYSKKVETNKNHNKQKPFHHVESKLRSQGSMQ